MTTAATKAREIAQHCEAKKHALRQTQDGIVVAFVLHPNDVPPALQLAPLGTRYMLALVEIGDDENPKEVMPAVKHNATADTSPASDSSPALVRARRPLAPEKRLAQQAGICCSDPVFQTFLFERDQINDKTDEAARLAIYAICEIKSRSEIIPGTPAAIRWDSLFSKFVAWREAA